MFYICNLSLEFFSVISLY